MSSRPVSVDPDTLRAAAGDNLAGAAHYTEHQRLVEQWITEVEAEIVRCHGRVAAPVGAALRGFLARTAAHAETAADQRKQLGENLNVAATRYQRGDDDAARAIASGGVL